MTFSHTSQAGNTDHHQTKKPTKGVPFFLAVHPWGHYLRSPGKTACATNGSCRDSTKVNQLIFPFPLKGSHPCDFFPSCSRRQGFS